MSKFGDYDTLLNCMNLENAKAYARKHYPSSDPDEKGKEISKWAINGNRFVKERQNFLYKTERKVETTVELIEKFGLKTITFSQSTEFASEVAKRLGDSAVVYHSKVESEIRMVEKTKVYKSKNKALYNFLEKNSKSKVREKNGTYEVYWKEPKKFGKNTLCTEAIERFKDNRYKVNTICTAMALDAGFNVRDCELGIDASRTQNPTQHTQRTGRIARNFTYKNGTKKRGIYINLYVPNSRDEGWLRACQQNSTNVVWMDSVDETVEFIKNILK